MNLRHGIILGVAILAVAVQSATNVVRCARYEEFGFSALLSDGTHGGVNEMVLSRLAAMNGWQIEWVECKSAELERKLENGEIDLAGGLSYSWGRMRKFNYSVLPMGKYVAELVVHGKDGWGPGETLGTNMLEIATAFDARVNNQLTEHLVSMGKSFRLRQCESFQEARRLFYQAKVPAMVTLGPFNAKGEQSVVKLPPIAGFIGVSKRRDDLLRGVNIAMVKLYEDEPGFFQGSLQGDFQAPPYRGNLFSRKEQEWLDERVRKGEPIRVDISPVMAPMKLWDEKRNEPRGFVKELFSEISRRTGLLFTFVEPSTVHGSRQRFRSGQIDIWTDFGLPGGEAHVGVERRIDLREPQLLVCRRDTMLEDSGAGVIAVPAWDQSRMEMYRRVKMGRRLLAFSSSREAVRAVLDRKADCVYLSAFMAWTLIHELKAETLLETRPAPRPHDALNFSFAMSPQAPMEMAAVLRKTLDGFSHYDFAAVMMRSSYESMSRPFMSTNGWMLLILLVLVGLLGFVGVMDVRQSRRLEAKAEERERLVLLRDSFFERTAKELMGPIDVIEAKAERLRTPDASREHVLEWTEGLIRNVDDLVVRLRRLVEYARLKREYERKWRQARGGPHDD